MTTEHQVAGPLRAGVPWIGREGDWLSPHEIAAALSYERRHIYDVLHRLVKRGALEKRDTTRAEATSGRWAKVAQLYRPTTSRQS